MLVRISLALNAVFSQAQSPAQAAPPSVPSSSVSTSAQRESQSMMLTASDEQLAFGADVPDACVVDHRQTQRAEQDRQRLDQ